MARVAEYDLAITEAGLANETKTQDETGSHSQSWNSGTTSNASVSLTGATVKILDVFAFVLFQITKRRTLTSLQIPLFVVELLQLLTFSLDDRFFHEDLQGKILRGLRHLRDPCATADGESNVAFVAIGITLPLIGINALLFAIQIFFVLRGALGALFIFFCRSYFCRL